MRRPCSSHVYHVTDTPASRATSSRRSPGVRRTRPRGSLTISGVSASRWAAPELRHLGAVLVAHSREYRAAGHPAMLAPVRITGYPPTPHPCVAAVILASLAFAVGGACMKLVRRFHRALAQRPPPCCSWPARCCSASRSGRGPVDGLHDRARHRSRRVDRPRPLDVRRATHRHAAGRRPADRRRALRPCASGDPRSLPSVSGVRPRRAARRPRGLGRGRVAVAELDAIERSAAAVAAR